jgi:hypothetical protein
LFELGPRTLRPVGDQGTVTLDMVCCGLDRGPSPFLTHVALDI